MSVNPVTLAITVALDAAQMAMTAMRKIEGPRVTDLSASVADYGTPLNYLYGVRRLECPCFYCEPIKETKTQTKGKSGKYTEYKYFGTFAILFADQLIDHYSRIWFDRHLVYDITGSGEDVVQPDDGHTLSDYMRQYLGTPDQGPDPRMVATITENEGPDRTPAYLDVAYIMFDGLPMEMLGNRFPQVSIEGNGGGAEIVSDWRVDFPFSIFVDAPNPYPNCYPGGFGVSGLLFHYSWQIAAQTEAELGGGFFGAGSWSSDGTYTDLVTSVTTNGVTITCTLTPSPGQFRFDFTTDAPDLQNQSPYNTHYVLQGAYQSGTCLSPFGYETAVDGDGNALEFNNGGTPSSIGPPGSGSPLYTAGWAISLAQFANGSPLPPTLAPITLAIICADVARRSGMATGDYDFTALDQLINGFSWTIGQGKQIVAPLVDLYDSDICLHDFQLIGRKRGGDFDDSGIIADAFLLRRADHASSSDQPLYQIILASESDLPRRVFLTYADLTGDQQPNAAVAQRNAISTATTREVPLDMTSLALSPDEAQPLVERWLRRQHIGANTFTYIASPGEIAVECADLRISSLGGELLRGRATRVTVQADRGIGVEWQVDGSVTADDV